MPIHYKAKQGDCISSIAFEYGFFQETIWNDPANRELKQKRRDPYILLPGDPVHIRDKEEKDELRPDAQRHRFRRRGVPEMLVVQFRIEEDPISDEPFVLEIDGALSEGSTDENGMIRRWIPPDAKRGKITFPGIDEEWELRVAHLDPITEISGVQGRLMDLGFFAGPADGKMSDDLSEAIRRFQQRHGLDVTGALDESTRHAIQQDFGD